MGTATFDVAQNGVPVNERDILRIITHNTSSLSVLDVNVRFLNNANQIVTWSQRITPLATGLVQNDDIVLSEGRLLSIAVAHVNAGVGFGVCFVQAVLFRGPAASGQPFHALFSDYATTGHPVGWPPGRQMHSTEGPGQLMHSTPAAPAAGADFSTVSPAYQRWELASFGLTLTTSAVAANRGVRFRISDGATIFFSISEAVIQPASTAYRYYFANVPLPAAVSGSIVVLPIPAGLIIPPGSTFETATANIQSGDQISAVSILARNWLEL